MTRYTLFRDKEYVETNFPNTRPDWFGVLAHASKWQTGDPEHPSTSGATVAMLEQCHAQRYQLYDLFRNRRILAVSVRVAMVRVKCRYLLFIGYVYANDYGVKSFTGTRTSTLPRSTDLLELLDRAVPWVGAVGTDLERT